MATAILAADAPTSAAKVCACSVSMPSGSGYGSMPARPTTMAADNPRVRWRYDPKLAGVSSVLADCGIHALHMACFITGQQVESLAADFASTIPTRQLEDDALVAFRMSGGAVGRLWTSAIAAGRMHGLTMQIFGEKA